jgi:cyclopropane fatty-acyl-phospholipid synthase-like methyltransferase
MAASLGSDATGIDLAGNALASAEQKARDRGLTARFLRHDARQLADLGERFDTVLDCGLFHLFHGTNPIADGTAYTEGLREVLLPGGRFFMLGFSDREPGDWPHKLGRDEIAAVFADGWRIDSIEPTTIETRLDSGDVLAWLAALTRI